MFIVRENVILGVGQRKESSAKTSGSLKKFYSSLDFIKLLEKFKEENPALKLIHSVEGYCHDGVNIYSMRKGTLKKMNISGGASKHIQLNKQYYNVNDIFNGLV